MTPRQRAGTILDRFELDRFTIGRKAITATELVDAMEKAIIAAIEEEREACAQLIDKQVAGMDILIDHAPTALRAEDLKRLRHSLTVAAAGVRTRE